MTDTATDGDIAPYSTIGLNGSTLHWCLDTETNAFRVVAPSDDEKLNELVYIDVLDDFLDCFEQKDRMRFTHHLSNIKLSRDAKAIRIQFSLDETQLLYCSISAYKTKDTEMQGKIILLFKLPKKSLFSDLFIRTFDNQSHGMLLTDQNANIVACNEKYEESLGYRLEEIIGKNTSLFKSGKFNDEFYVALWASVQYQGFWSGKILSKRKDGKIIPIELTIQSIKFNENLTYFTGMTKDLSESLDSIKGEEVGGIELFTQLPNKSTLLQKIDTFTRERQKGESLFLIVLHPEIEYEKRSSFRSQMSDAFNKTSNSFNCGYLRKNRFAIAVHFKVSSERIDGVLPKKELSEVIDYLRQNVSKEFFVAIGKSNIGVSIFDIDANSAQELLTNASLALEEGHQTAINNICVFDASIHYELKRKKGLEKYVKMAILAKSVEVYYQPIIDTATWTVCKLETLCRFRDKKGAFLNTQEAVKTAENMGLVEELDLLVAEKSIRDMGALSTIFGTDVSISVNVSLSTESTKDNVLNRFLSLFRRYRNEAKSMCIEITESAYFEANDEQVRLFERIKDQGVSIAIDDFGTGYSSFTYLKDTDFDILKIDREFVTGLQRNSRNFHIVNMIITLANKLDIKTIVEGVETIQEAELLYDIGADMLQGYYFSRPQSIDELRDLSVLLYETKQCLENKEVESLVTQPIFVMPDSPLHDVKHIFDTQTCQVLPVLNDNVCVGLVNKLAYNLSISHSLDTELETAKDLSALNKRVIQIMDAKFNRISGMPTSDEIVERIRLGEAPPWVVDNGVGHYIGLVVQESVLKILASSNE